VRGRSFYARNSGISYAPGESFRISSCNTVVLPQIRMEINTRQSE